MAFQKFISEDGQRLPSLPKHPCDNSDDEYYLLWSDIKQTFEDINYLKNRTGERVLFMTDKEFKLCLPLRVRDSDSDAYTIINMSKKDVAARVVRMNVPRCNSHQDSKVGKSALDIPSVCRSYLQIYSLLGNTRNAMFDHRVEANLVYFYDTFLKMFENLGCLEDDRKQLLEEKTRIMVEEIQELHRNIRQKVYLAAGHRMLRNFIADSGLSKPRLFIVLPSDFGSWQDSDTTTHTFRLFFLCDPQASRDPQNEIIPRHMHFSNHPGYKVHQPQEFLRKYGEYILMLLETIKHGKIHKHDFLRQLDPGKTSTGRPSESCDLTSGRLGPLIDKTIAYILSLSPPRWSSNDPNLHPSETRDIKQYLDAEERNDVVGDLNRYCIGDRTRWVCLGHLSCYVQIDDLQKLAQFVRNQKGSINIQSGDLNISLTSEYQTREFLNYLYDSKHRFNVSITLEWDISRSFRIQLLQKLFDAKVQSLEMQGLNSDTHGCQFGSYSPHIFDVCFPAMTNTAVVRLLHYPRPSIQYVSILRFCYTFELFCLLNGDDTDWWGLANEICNQAGTTRKNLQSWTMYDRAAADLKDTLAKYGLSATSGISFRGNSGWQGYFDLETGGFSQVRYYRPDYPKFLASRFLRQLTVESDDILLRDILPRCDRIQMLNIMAHERRAPHLLEQVIRHGHIRSTWIRLTLFERVEDGQGRVLMQLKVSSQIKSSARGSDGSRDRFEQERSNQNLAASLLNVKIIFSRWDCNDFSVPLSDSTVTLLATATRQRLACLKSIILDVYSLSQEAIAGLKGIFLSSKLEKLIVISRHVPHSHQTCVGQMLSAIRRSPLKSIVFTGQAINELLELWSTSTRNIAVNTSPFGPCLQRLDIIGSGAAPQQLSHISALFLHHVIYSSSLIEMHLENLQMKECYDWELIAEAIDLSFLESLSLSENMP